MATLYVTVTVSGTSSNYTVTVSPKNLQVDQDGTFDIIWQAGSPTVAFTFSDTDPVVFTGSHAPLSTPVYNSANNTVSCTDTVTTDGSYPYELNLVVDGQPLNWTSVGGMSGGDPEIDNKPRGG
jgi:hypothetical protein